MRLKTRTALLRGGLVPALVLPLVTTAQDGLDTAREALDGASLVASFDGTVASVDLTVGEELAGSPLVDKIAFT
ncbi:MAG TPA: hypothetical protein PLA11_17585, partial [Flavobacteriales bacterium]|nr:hypothetical protein [Flavobacteriales bacterium]